VSPVRGFENAEFVIEQTIRAYVIIIYHYVYPIYTLEYIIIIYYTHRDMISILPKRSLRSLTIARANVYFGLEKCNDDDNNNKEKNNVLGRTNAHIILYYSAYYYRYRVLLSDEDGSF